MDVVGGIGELLLSIGSRMNRQKREKVWGAIAVAWLGSVIISILLGLFSTDAFLSNVAANFVADLLVAAMLFITVDLIFGFSRRQEERMEAISKATSMLGVEIIMNRKELARIIEDFEKGRTPAPPPKLETENWELFAQSPLAQSIPNDLFWKLAEAFWHPKKLLEIYRMRASSTSPADHPKVASELLPLFQQVQEILEEADKALAAAYLKE